MTLALIYRQTPEDFRVTEVPLYTPSGSGGYWHVRVVKRGVDTTDVARGLAENADCSPRDVGFAGRKDRWAVAEQWFSVPATEGAFRGPDVEGVEVQEIVRHHDRIRTGELLGNRFELVVRDVPGDQQMEIAERARAIRQGGFANRFGTQRFGSEGDNPDRGLAILRGDRALGDRRTARFLVSALQSKLFNAALEHRLQEVGLSRLVDGDLAWLHRNGSLYWIDCGEDEQHRADRLELSPTGPLFGDKMRRPFGIAGRWEQEVLQEAGLNETLFRSRRGLRLSGARRPYRAVAGDLEVVCEASTARVTVMLAPGSYASVLLEELFGAKLEEADRRGECGEHADRVV